MALTIVDKPYQITPVNQKLIVVLYDSANNSNDGFKYSITVTRVSDSVVVFSGLFDQNVNGYGVIDLRPILSSLITTTNNSTDADNVHKSIIGNRENMEMWTVDVTDGWNIDGVFTLDTANVNTYLYAFWNGEFTLSQGYKPNPEDIYRLNHLDNSSPKKILSSRTPNLSNRYQIPSASSNDIVNKCGADDWGVMSFIPYQDTITSDVDIFQTNNRVTGVRIQFYNSAHTVISTTNETTLFVSGPPTIQHLMAYPQNMQEYIGSLGDWAYYSIQFLEANLADPSRPYVINPKHWFYREECEVRYEKVRLGWLNHHGGWDYFNFTKKNELTTEVDRKRIKNTLGDYSTSGGVFTMDTGIGETQEITVDSKLFMDITSGWIDEYDFEFLSSLIRSKRVHIVKADGSFIPVLVETNSWLHRRIRSAKKYQANIKLQLANGWQQM